MSEGVLALESELAGCERICEPNAAQRLRRRGTRRTGVDGPNAPTCVFETYVATCGSHWLAHNLEIASADNVPAISEYGRSRTSGVGVMTWEHC